MCPYCNGRFLVSCLYSAHAGRDPNSSGSAASKTAGPLAVALRSDSSGPGPFARTDCWPPSARVSDDMQKHLSAETIYAGLYVLPRGGLRSTLLAALRQARKTRRPRARGTDRRGQIPNMTLIAERPAEVATRTIEVVSGIWTGCSATIYDQRRVMDYESN